MSMSRITNCPHSADSWCLDCVRKEHDELTKRAEDAENEAVMLAGRLTDLKAEITKLHKAFSRLARMAKEI